MHHYLTSWEPMLTAMLYFFWSTVRNETHSTCAYMIYKKRNIFVTVIATALIHAIAETLIVYIGCLMGAVATNEFGLGFYTVVTFAGTALHHCVDFAIAFLGLKVLRSARLID